MHTGPPLADIRWTGLGHGTSSPSTHRHSETRQPRTLVYSIVSLDTRERGLAGKDGPGCGGQPTCQSVG